MGVAVGPPGVWVGTNVGVLVGVEVGVDVNTGVHIGVLVGVAVGVGVYVAVLKVHRSRRGAVSEPDPETEAACKVKSPLQ